MMRAIEGRHLIVTMREWKTIVNALDLMELILKGEQLDKDLFDALVAAFEPDKVSKLSEKICLIK